MPGIIRHYAQYLPIKKKNIVTLDEGDTPLLRARNLEDALKLTIKLFLKCEGLNPTCSFKDRGMTYAVSKAREKGVKTIICASTGNTSASASAYAAQATMKCIVLIPEGKIAYGKLAQAIIHGAQVLQIRGNFDAALQRVLEIARKRSIEIVNSVNPHRLQGQKTAAFEVCDVLGCAPDYHFLPVGNAGNITAYWMGYKEYLSAGKIKKAPKMMGYQASGSAPIVLGAPVEKPETVASAIRIGNPASWKGAVHARDESGGVIDKVDDDEIIRAYQLIASCEGIFCEPASAVSVAGVIKFLSKKKFRKGQTVVCTLTGHGLKDPDTAISFSTKPKVVDANLDAILSVL